MKEYKCDNCGRIINENHIDRVEYKEYVDYWGANALYTTYIDTCCFCGSDELDPYEEEEDV